MTRQLVFPQVVTQDGKNQRQRHRKRERKTRKKLQCLLGLGLGVTVHHFCFLLFVKMEVLTPVRN